MSDINEQLTSLSTKTGALQSNKVARFAFTEAAYTNDIADGVESYDYANDQNVPLATKTEFNDTILSKGLRSQSASIPRSFLNHFFGRVSYNLNKLVDFTKVLFDSVITLNKLAGRYTDTTKYLLNDVCSMVVSVAGTPQVMTFIRITSTPTELSGVPPLSVGVLNANWAEAFAYKADSDDANFTGTPTAPTAAAGTNTTQIATTAFVIAEIGNQRPYSNANPVMDGTAAQGSSTRVSRQDHVHPTDNTRAPLAGPAFTGTPTAPTAAVGTNTTQIATTAFVIAEITNQRPYSNANPVMDGTAAQGSSTRVSRQDHVHPTDTTRAPLAGPAFTGTPTAPTAAAGTNTTQIATTAFVTAGLALKANLASPALTGTPTAPTATAGTNTTQIATTAFVTAGLSLKANLASPAFTGTPTAPTAPIGTDTTQLATTAFVDDIVTQHGAFTSTDATTLALEYLTLQSVDGAGDDSLAKLVILDAPPGVYKIVCDVDNYYAATGVTIELSCPDGWGDPSSVTYKRVSSGWETGKAITIKKRSKSGHVYFRAYRTAGQTSRAQVQNIRLYHSNNSNLSAVYARQLVLCPKFYVGARTALQVTEA